MSRISSTQMTFGYLKQLQGSYKKYNELFEQADGSKLHRSSDDSVAYAKYLRYQNSSANNDQYQKDVKTAMSWMKATDDALTNVTDIYKTFSEKVISAGNETNKEKDMEMIAKELIQEMREVVDEMNRTLGDRYVFSGQSDTTVPFLMSADKMERGEAKTLNEGQQAFFGADATGDLTQFLVLKGDDRKEYCLDINNGYIYDKDFVDNGYKQNILAGQTEVDFTKDAVGKISVGTGGDFTSVNDYFRNNGVIRNDSPGVDGGRNGWDWNVTVGGVKMSFSTQAQYIAHYSGDDKQISMVTQKGATKPSADTVNVSAQKIFGSDIFDYAAPEGQSGTALLNEMLAVVSQVDSANYRWSGDDGITITNAAYSTMLGAQTTVAARYQAYEITDSMLITQQESLMDDINYIGGTDISKLATQLAQYQTIYSLSISMGGKLFPGTLADYLR